MGIPGYPGQKGAPGLTGASGAKVTIDRIPFTNSFKTSSNVVNIKMYAFIRDEKVNKVSRE